MRRLFFSSLLALVGCAGFSLAAVQHRIVPIHHESLKVLGWNRECSVAITYLGFPFLGDASIQDPVKTRIGTLTIAPGAESSAPRWLVSADGVTSWNHFAAADSERDLKKEGYARPGWRETVRPEPVIEDPDLQQLLLSTATFHTNAPDMPMGFPGTWRLAQVHYAPIASTCGLLVF